MRTTHRNYIHTITTHNHCVLWQCRNGETSVTITMSAELYNEALKICQRHADRLHWPMEQIQSHMPFTANTLEGLSDIELAVLDKFSTRFLRLQDVMGEKLFPAVLELTREQGDLTAFIDKLHRLEKIGAIASKDDWLLLGEMRDAFSHEYPDDLALQAAIINNGLQACCQFNCRT